MVVCGAMQRLVDGITHDDAQLILNRPMSWIDDRIRDGTLSGVPGSKRPTLSLQAVEKLALDQWLPRRHAYGGYWATCIEAAELLEVSPARVRQLAERGRLPGAQVRGKWWLFRRQQLAVVARARRARWHGDEGIATQPSPPGRKELGAPHE